MAPRVNEFDTPALEDTCLPHTPAVQIMALRHKDTQHETEAEVR